MFFFFKPKTAYEMRISDLSSDVCSSDLGVGADAAGHLHQRLIGLAFLIVDRLRAETAGEFQPAREMIDGDHPLRAHQEGGLHREQADRAAAPDGDRVARSEEHTSELQSLMRISYAVFCLQKKKTHH